MTKKATPVVKDWHPAQVLAALRMSGWSMRPLGMSHGYGPTSLKNVLVRPWPKAERIVSDALGIAPEVIWPSRYQAKPSRAEVLRELSCIEQFSAVIVTDKADMSHLREAA